MSYVLENHAEPRTTPLTSRVDWLAARREGIGASDVPAILGLDRYRSALDVYADKAGLLPLESEFPSDAAKFGLRLEDDVADEFAERTSWPVALNKTLFRSTRYPWIQATPDGFVTLPEKRVGLLQIKTTNARNEGEWAAGPPVKVVAQVMTEMLVTGIREAFVACLIGGQNFVWAAVPYSEELAASIVLESERLWAAVQKREAPVGSAGLSLDAVKRIYASVVPAKTVSLPLEIADEVLDWKHWKERESDAKLRAKAAEARIREAMRDAEIGTLEGGGMVTLREVRQPEKIISACAYRVLRFVEPKV